MATYLSRTPSSAGNRKKYTWSGWVKRCSIDGTQQNLMAVSTANNDFNLLYFSTTEELVMYFADNAATAGYLQSTRKFRDPNAWYHIVARVDTTHGTADNRIRLYVNGEQLTNFVSRVNPSVNYEGLINTSGNRMDISGSGAGMSSGANNFKGLMSHVHFLDGEDRDASYFGSTDSTTGEWQINTSPTGINYGTNGFFILKDGNSVTDQSGQSNNLAVTAGTLTKTEDNPSNSFTTLNPLVYTSTSVTYGHGNSSITASSSGQWASIQSTLGASSGKYYCEIKINSVGSYQAIGVGYQPNISNNDGTQLIGELNGSAGWRNNGALVHGGSNINTYTTGDILMIAMDLDNQKLYFGKNGTWENSGVPTSGSTGTGSVKDLTANQFYHFVIVPRGGSNYCNFGNGFYGTTAISSEGTNASGIGKFEYDVPSGYTALSTKGLNL